MAKSFVVGNGNIAIGLDLHGQIYDLYYPYVGLENHTGGKYLHKIGFYVDNKMHWIDNGNWEFDYHYNIDGEFGHIIIAKNQEAGIKVSFDDEVYNEKNILIRSINIENLEDREKQVKVYFNHQYEIYESVRGDTAYYDPERNVLIHYKGRRIFLSNARVKSTGRPFDDYSVGLFGIEGREGTYKDAEDGKLEKNPIEHGLTDSVLGLTVDLAANDKETVEYWLCMAKVMEEAIELNNYVLQKTPEYLLRTTKDFWSVWINQVETLPQDLDSSVKHLFYNSCRVLRIHTDNNGAVIASSDSDMLKYGRDTYSYVWPRDSAFVSVAFSRVGLFAMSKNIFSFFNDTITKYGYFMHKYRSDKSLGSSWHPWIYKGLKELPIQLDETALIVFALYEYYQSSRDVEFIESVYNTLMVKALSFVISRIDSDTGIVAPSYDLWEENFASGLFTSCTAYGALNAGAELAQNFGKEEQSAKYKEAAEKIKEGILNHYYDDERGYFAKNVLPKEYNPEGTVEKDWAVDSSGLYGLFKFKLLDVNHPYLLKMQNAVDTHLKCKTKIGGIPRYQDDRYFRADQGVTGNPWIITTLWFAQLQIAQAKNLEDLIEPTQAIEWVVKHASSSGIIPEQLHPTSGEHISASPLVWSHAEYIVTVLDLLKKQDELKN